MTLSVFTVYWGRITQWYTLTSLARLLGAVVTIKRQMLAIQWI